MRMAAPEKWELLVLAGRSFCTDYVILGGQVVKCAHKLFSQRQNDYKKCTYTASTPNILELRLKKRFQFFCILKHRASTTLGQY